MNVILAAFLATTATYGLTALGAGFVLCWQPTNEQMQKVMSLAIGLMLSAVVGLFTAATEESEKVYGKALSSVPICVGTVLATAVLIAFDRYYPEQGLLSPRGDGCNDATMHCDADDTPEAKEVAAADLDYTVELHPTDTTSEQIRKSRLVVFALALQHIPEALACGVAFAAIEQGAMSWTKAATISIAIGLQDIPEGATAAMVLLRLGKPKWEAFNQGQLTGIAQPVAGLLGAAMVIVIEPLLPYALAFAAAAMLFVIVKDMIPDALNSEGDASTMNTCWIMLGFIIMQVVSSLLEAM